ncbi:hypothetical protein H9P43_006565 [Blastocladiella emersonii ATCC 22665]|nr:hypothetical protein H9P43_006565 [Blastocladiella emersonii ATCC 22665]
MNEPKLPATSPPAPADTVHAALPPVDRATALLSAAAADQPCDDAAFSLAFLAVTAQAARTMDLAAEMLLSDHWPRAAQLAVRSDTTHARARCVTAALLLHLLPASATASLGPVSPGTALAGWIDAGADALPLFYAALMSVATAPPAKDPKAHPLARAAPHLFTAPAFFDAPFRALQWLYFWQALSRDRLSPVPQGANAAGKGVPLVQRRSRDAVLAALFAAPATTPASRALLLLATVSVSLFSPHTKQLAPPKPMLKLLRAVAADPLPPVAVEAVTFALLLISTQTKWDLPTACPELLAHLAAFFATSRHVLRVWALPPAAQLGPADRVWPPVLGPLGHLVGRFITSPRVPLPLVFGAVDSVSRTLAAPDTDFTKVDLTVAQRVLFLVVMFGQDVVARHATSPLPASALVAVLAHLQHVHAITLRVTDNHLGATPFPSYADHLAELTQALLDADVLDAATDSLAQTSQPHALAFAANWIAADPRLVPRVSAATLADLAAHLDHLDSGSVAWEAVHWLVVVALDANPATSADLAVWYAAHWYTAGRVSPRAPLDDLARSVRWRAVAAVAAVVEEGDGTEWLADLVSAADGGDGDDALVALCVLANAVHLSAVPAVLGRIEAMVADRGGVSSAAAAAVMDQWDLAGGLRWDRHVALARWWNGLVVSRRKS